VDNAHRLMRWRVELIRGLDPAHVVVAHGIAATLTQLASRAADDWRAAAEVEAYGYTWGSSRHGDEAWKQYHAVDLVRSATRGKPFWHAEAYAGPLWLQPQVIGKPRNEGRVASPEDIRHWDMVSFAAGARGLFYLRWRPLLDGPLFGAFGAYGMDGSRTPRSEMVSSVGNWAQHPNQKGLMQARPVKGDIGILVVPESQLFNYAQQGSTDFYARAAEGAYQGFFDNNIQADWVRLEHIDEYDVVYLPFPVMLAEKTAKDIRRWVEAGGTLISEGCPAYFGDHAHVGEVQPNLGLDELFGARESYVEFTPDLLGDLTLSVGGQFVRGGVFLQAYTPTTGTPVGSFSDGRIAAIEHRAGSGRTLLIGTFPGYAHGQHPQHGCREFFAWLLRWAGKTQHVTSTQPSVTARLHSDSDAWYLWTTNPTHADLPVRLEISPDCGSHTRVRALWGASKVRLDGRTIELTIPARDAVVLELT
jgi:beta-galactosidase